MKSIGWSISVGAVFGIISLVYPSGCHSRRIGIGKCGNNIVEEGEVCDGIDLGGETCVSQGYESGTLACLPDCSGYDTSGCSGGASGRKIISTGEAHTCEVKNGGRVWCWGYNSYGQLGDGTVSDRSTPTKVVGLTDVAVISGGLWHTCAAKTDGSAWCWGRNNYGQLGDGTTTARHTPIQVSGLSNVAWISGGRYHTCVVRTDSTAWCWGRNYFGQLGDGTNDRSIIPIQVDGLSDAVEISSGTWHTCAKKIDGTAWCWGYNWDGTLGDGTNEHKNTPVQIFEDVNKITGGGFHTCAVKSNGTPWCWGWNKHGQVGNGEGGHYAKRETIPVEVLGLSEVSAMSSGFRHTCAVKVGTTWCWGDNEYGQLGDGTTEERHTPVKVVLP